MHTYKGTSFAEAYQKSLIDLVDNGDLCETRGTTSKELLNVSLEITDPSQCMYTNMTRSTQTKYIAAELLWYYAGRNDVAFISKYAKFWEQIQNPNGTVNSAYGNLIFRPKSLGGITQYEWAIASLAKDKDSRQAILHFNTPEHQYNGNKDFVCTIYLNFWIRDNKLNMKVQMRSNDIFYGLSYDAPFFAYVQQTMYLWLRDKYKELQLGTYYHCADNIHYYERHFEIADNIKQEKVKDPFFFMLREPMFTLSEGTAILTDTGNEFINDVDQLINTNIKITQEQSKETLNKYFFIQ
jgi:thymidylate synthase